MDPWKHEVGGYSSEEEPQLQVLSTLSDGALKPLVCGSVGCVNK